MEKRYIKPEMMVSEIEMGELMNIATSGVPGEGEFNSKPRGGRTSVEEEWVEDVDLWGNASWTRTN